MDVTSGVPQEEGTVMFCIVVKDLPAALKFSELHLFAGDLKILSINNNWLKVQSDLGAVDSWVEENKLTLAMDKCFELTFRGDGCKFFLQGVVLKSTKVMEDLGVYMSDYLTWHANISAGMEKANSVFYLLKRNVFYKLQAPCKLRLYKSLLLPVLTYRFYCAALSRTDMKSLEKFQKSIVQWIFGSKVSNYINQLRLLNLLLYLCSCN